MGLSVVSSFQNLGTRAENWACMSPERLHEQHPMSIQYPLLGLCHFAGHPLGESTGQPLCLCVSSTRDRKTASDCALEARKRWRLLLRADKNLCRGKPRNSIARATEVPNQPHASSRREATYVSKNLVELRVQGHHGSEDVFV
jgi:hypothetical protein